MICEICGKEFDWNKKGRPTLVCDNPKCKEASRERHRVIHNRQKRTLYMQRKCGVTTKLTLSQVAMMAREAGMTYGQFVAQTEHL